MARNGLSLTARIVMAMNRIDRVPMADRGDDFYKAVEWLEAARDANGRGNYQAATAFLAKARPHIEAVAP
jgi:hypothetical protein